MALLNRDDTTLFFESAGHGEPILFIQGVGVSGRGWLPQVRDLSTGFATLVFDNRGLGRSVPCRGPIEISAMADDAQALLDAAGWTSAHIVGHSMGGIIAQHLALTVPERVRSLSLLCTFARGREAARLTPWVLWMTLRTRLGSRSARRRAFLEMLYPTEYLQRSDQETLAAEVGDLIGRDLADSPPILLQQVRALGRHDLSQRLGELAAIPTLVVSASQDPIARPSYGRDLASRVPGAVFELIPEVSHGLPLHRPDLINDRLKQFLQQVDSTPRTQ